jgi:drug/metabolite transporter (DMT)-like permease
VINHPTLTSAPLGLIVVAVLWGATFTVGRAAVDDVPAVTTGMLRFGIAGLALLPIYVIERRGRPLLPQGVAAWRAITLLAVTAVAAYNALFFGGLRLAPSSDGILLVPTTSPVWTALFAALILRERQTIRLRVGMAIALLGMGLVMIGGPDFAPGEDRFTGNLLFVGAACVFGLSHVIGRIAITHVTPLGATTIAGLLGALLLLPGALIEGGPGDLASAPFNFWLFIAFIGIGGSALAYVLWYHGVRELGPGRAGFFTNLVPIFGLSLSAMFLAEYPSPMQIGGGVVMLGAVIWGTRKPVSAIPMDLSLSTNEVGQ